MAHGLSSADVPAAKKLLRAAHTPFTPPRAGNEEQMHGLSKATRDEEHSVLTELSPRVRELRTSAHHRCCCIPAR